MRRKFSAIYVNVGNGNKAFDLQDEFSIECNSQCWNIEYIQVHIEFKDFHVCYNCNFSSEWGHVTYNMYKIITVGGLVSFMSDVTMGSGKSPKRRLFKKLINIHAILNATTDLFPRL